MASKSVTLNSTSGGNFILTISGTVSNSRLDNGVPLSTVSITAKLACNTGRFSGGSVGTLYVDFEDTFGNPSWVNKNSKSFSTLYNSDYTASESTSASFNVQHDGSGNLSGWARARWTKGSSNYQPNSGSVDVALTFPHITVVQYDINYNANGGNQNTCPSSQVKDYDVSTNIASQIPTHSDTFTQTYLITFDPGDGTASYTELNPLDTWSYSFNNWNSSSDGTGTTYAPGASYSANADLTLYAQWTSSVTPGTVIFPSATQTGFDLVGWTRDPNNVILVDEGYIPTQNETLYAVWSVHHGYINTRSNTGWKMPTIKAKEGSNWKIILDSVWTQQAARLPSAYTELSYITCTGTQYINPDYTINVYSELELDFMADSETYIAIFGNNVASSYDGGARFFWSQGDGALYCGFGANRGEDRLHDLRKNIRYKAILNKNFATINNTNVTTATGTKYYQILFGADKANTAITFSGRIYGASIREGTSDVRKLIPCIRNSDSVIGMYDTVYNMFYTNAGTGTFGAGPKRTAWGNPGVNNTYSWFFVEGTEYPSKEDWTWRQWLDSVYNTDMWEPVEINGVYYIGIEPDVGGYFCITNESGTSEANLLNKPIKNDFSYTIGRK